MKQKKMLADTAISATLNLAEKNIIGYDCFASNKLVPNQNHFPLKRKDTNETTPIFKNITTIVKLYGEEIKIHALCTGCVSVKNNFRTKRGLGELAKLNILLDKNYTEYLPIWVWVIEHPDGLIVIDTGEDAKIKDLDKYLVNESSWSRFQFKHACKFKLDTEDELNYQFNKINLKLDDVKLVVLTHMHLDHTDGLKFFPKKEIIIGNHEVMYPSNSMLSTFPSWFKPNRVEYQPNKIEIFDCAYPITSKEDLLYIPTPGHTHGHSSIVFKTDHFDLVFGGDASYNQNQVIKGELAGVNVDYKKSLKTYRDLIAYATNRPTIYLPTHDADAAQRLLNKEFLIAK